MKYSYDMTVSWWYHFIFWQFSFFKIICIRLNPIQNANTWSSKLPYRFLILTSISEHSSSFYKYCMRCIWYFSASSLLQISLHFPPPLIHTYSKQVKSAAPRYISFVQQTTCSQRGVSTLLPYLWFFFFLIHNFQIVVFQPIHWEQYCRHLYHVVVSCLITTDLKK